MRQPMFCLRNVPPNYKYRGTFFGLITDISQRSCSADNESADFKQMNHNKSDLIAWYS